VLHQGYALWTFEGSFLRHLHLVKRYVNVKVPEELAREIDKLIDKKVLGYRSRAEFIIEAIREKLSSVQRYGKA